MSPTKLNSTTLSLLIGDIVIFASSLLFALTIRNFTIPESSFFIQHIYPFSIVLLMWIALFIIGGMYDQTYLTIKRSIGSTLLTLQIAGGGIAVLLFYLVPTFAVTPKTNLALFLVIFSFLIWLWRKLFFTYIQPVTETALLIGEHALLQSVLSQHNMYGLVIAENGSWESLRSVSSKNIDVLLCDFSDPGFEIHAEAIKHLIMKGVRVIDTNRVHERITGQVPLSRLTTHWFISHVEKPSRIYQFIKRIIDLVCGVVLYLFMIVLLPLVAILTLITERRLSLFFTQNRVGLLGHEFKIYKLRTMSVSDQSSWSGKNHTHITKLGSVLRALRIDELPQSINMIRGEMSLVGPRALMISEQEQMQKLVPAYSQRLFVKPGITGWAQIKQTHAPQNEQEASDRLSYDLYYLVHASLLFDVLIILKTIKTVLLRTGIRP